MLAEVKTIEDAKGMLDQAATMQHYAARLKAGIEVERPIAIGVLKIKVKLGEMMPANPPNERGQGRGGKEDKSIATPAIDLSPNTITAFRKLAANKERLEEYYDSTEDVPTQGDFLKYVTGPHVSNNSIENEWYTPTEWIDAARKTMGGIDLDPASCDEAQKYIKAKKFFSIADDGLTKVWRGRIWLNPPYSRDLCPRFIEKLLLYFREDAISQACVLINNATETAWFQDLLKECCAVCFPAGRISFLDRTGKPANKPLQGQVIAYFGNQASEFQAQFGTRGTILFSGKRS